MENKKKGIVTLLGAGASVEAGVPSAKKMASLFFDQIKAECSEDEITLIKKIRSLVSFEIDIEFLVSALDLIANPKQSPLNKMVKEWKFDMNEGEIKNVARSLIKDIRATLLGWLEPKNDCTYLATVSRFALYLDESDYESKLKFAHVFTLNWDLCTEIAFINKHIPYETGFEEMQGQQNNLFCRWDHGLLGLASVTLYKLHGSLNWGTINGIEELVCEPIREFGDGGLRNARKRLQDDWYFWGEKLDPFGKVPGIIFSQNPKFVPYMPYLELQAHFENSLKDAKALVVIGYSWRDEYINKKIRSASNNGLKVINVARQARNISYASLSLGGGARAALEGKPLYLKDGTKIKGGLVGAIYKYFPDLKRYVN